MGDVLFDTGKSDLRSEAASLSPSSRASYLTVRLCILTIEDDTDSTGSAELNQTLSEKRAGSVQDYLVGQGLDAASLSATGFWHG